jgi:flavin reductase (DIM6/NTAB) family NADH-FMN oxidoreductase RutF
VTIHATDPFGTPEGDRSTIRRLRGRLPAAVTLWTAYDQRRVPVGLTVSSTLVVDGEPGRILGLLDEESDLYGAARASGRFAVSVLRLSDRRLADAFAGVVPVPGGPFRAGGWRATDHGPVPDSAETVAECRLDEVSALGWGVLVTGTIERVHLGREDEPLIYYRGRYVGRLSGRPELNG